METISIKDIMKMMLNKLWLIILLMVLGGGAMFFNVQYATPLRYQSFTTMYVKNANQPIQTVVNVNDLNTAKSLVNTYIAVLRSDTIMDELADAVLDKFGQSVVKDVFGKTDGAPSAGAVRACFAMSAVNDTEVMKITATTTDPEVSAYLCKTIAELAPEFLTRVVGAGSVETIDEAQITHIPISKGLVKKTILGALVGMVLAAVIIFLIDFFDNTVKESSHLSEKHGMPILGEIQDIVEDKKKKKEKGEKTEKGKKSKHADDHYLITDTTTPFYVTESYKAMRTNLIFFLSTSERKIFAVSSSMPNEGKSTTASNIAIALSQLENTKVLLIDGDMRKPIQHKIFNIKNKNGLSSALGKLSKTEQCIQKNVVGSLDIMPAGVQPPNPAELLNSDQMEKLLTELSGKYDYIIIDMPPVNVVSDPLTIGRLIAGIAVVVKYGSTTFEDVKEVVKRSELSDSKLLGFVMTRVKHTESGRSYYNKKYKYDYKSGYGYGPTPEKSEEEKNA